MRQFEFEHSSHGDKVTEHRTLSAEEEYIYKIRNDTNCVVSQERCLCSRKLLVQGSRYNVDSSRASRGPVEEARGDTSANTAKHNVITKL